ncbi:cation:proton antiporter domain-containing protein [Mongoliitalea daihaiensis]|uniref:cation:proton antiporter domain-containing protein n=1 Tax=Mongoliitalea daihaiensis TaxID=2782006 RepID=UPI001F1E3246|nr:cation:proton antiporter [Mongoliitalea daihaiensis]UJP63301.1 cation:proton antiporter [Mongoliitalea daihaiensis]
MLNFILASAEMPMLSDLVWIFGLATLVILVFMRFKVPTIIGFLFTGALAGPYGLSLVQASTTVEVLSEIGVILLLFVIGMEFSLKSLMAIKKAVFIGGSLQVFITIGVSTLLASLLGFEWNVAVFIGFLISLSSTAIVLKLLQEAGQVNTISGRTTLAVLIFQDIVIVPLMLFTPMLAGESDNIALSLFLMAAKGVAVIAITIVTAKYLMPQLLFRIAKTRNEELFLLSIIVICFAIAYLTSLLGLSLGLGAFLAGLIISESDYSHHATGKILPFREVFLSFFFVSVGMLFDITFLFKNIGVILLLTLLTFGVKFIITTLSVKAIGQNFKDSIIVGLSIFQIGEFSLLLAKEGMRLNLLDPVTYQYFLAISILTMTITPFLLNNREKLAFKIINLPVSSRLNKRFSSKISQTIALNEDELKDHLVIIGYGLNGRNLSLAAKSANIPYVIIEMNPETVKVESSNGEPIIYGDAANETVLEHVNINKARVAVVAISNADSTKRIVSTIRHMSSNPYIIVRTRYVNEIEENINLGANEVIPEEFETSIEIFYRVLDKYLVARHDIESFTEEIRSHNYELFRTPLSTKTQTKIDLPEINFVCLKVEKDSGQYVNVALKDAKIRDLLGINIVAIKRNGKTITDIKAEQTLKFGDAVYVVGKPDAIEIFEKELEVD